MKKRYVMDTVSIIVPIYNAGKYISACLDSILKQTYKHFEVILVDDGSSDTSARICDFYKRKDCRITVYHRKNAGVSASRNFGLAKATGKYIAFVDADDTIEPNMLEGYIRLAQKYEADLVISSFRYYMTDDNDRMVENSLGVEFCETEKELFDQWFATLIEKEILNPPWNKFIKKELLDTNQIQFNEIFSICEDMAFSVQILASSKKTVLTGEMYYNYYIKSFGTLVFRFHENYFEALSYFYESAYAYCKKYSNNSKQLRCLNTLYINLTLMFLKKICINPHWDKVEKYKRMRAINNSKKFLFAIKTASLNRRRKLICFLLQKGHYFLIQILYLLKSYGDKKGSKGTPYD